MSGKIPMRCLEAGSGWAVWDAELPEEPDPYLVSEADAIADAQTFETVTLYRPVAIDASGDAAEAFYYADEFDFDRDDGWRIYVDPRHVRTSPPERAYPAYRFGVNGPDEAIAPEDVPDDVRE